MNLLILLTLKACISFPYCCTSRISCSFCFYFHFPFSLLSAQLFFFCSLYSSETFILSLWHTLPSLESSWILGQNIVYSSGYTFCYCFILCLQPYCLTPQDFFFGLLFSFCPFFLNHPTHTHGFNYYLCANNSKILFSEPSEFLIYIFKYSKSIPI